MKKTIPYGNQSIDKRDISAVVSVLRGDWLTQGPSVKKFEDALCRYTGARYAVAVSNGTAALHVACLAAGIGKGDEVITSPVTFLASANCALYCGARPVFGDVDPVTANITLASIKKATCSRTKAVIPVHYAGLSCDMKSIGSFAKRRGMAVIEDACHALGASYKGAPVGSCRYSDMSVFSFHPVKSITTGEGGAVMTNDPGLYKSLLSLRNHGIDKDGLRDSPGDWYYEMRSLGYNYRLTDIQSALGLSQLRKLASFINRRKEIAKIYNRAFKGNVFFDIPVMGETSAWHLYAIRLKDPHAARRKEIFASLRSSGIWVQVHYVPVHTQPYYRKHVCGVIQRLGAQEYYRRAISIPMYPQMSEKDVDRVISVLRETCQEVCG